MAGTDLEDDVLDAQFVDLIHGAWQAGVHQHVSQSGAGPFRARDGTHVVLGQTGHADVIERRATVA